MTTNDTTTIGIDLSSLIQVISDQSSALASAWSEAADSYTEWFVKESETRIVTEAERTQAYVERLGKQYDIAARQAQQWADAASDTGVGQIIQRYADKYAEQARRLQDQMVDANVRMSEVIADTQRGVEVAHGTWGGDFGKAVGPVFDAAQMTAGAVEWSQTGDSTSFGEAATGVAASWAAGIVVGTAATMVGFPAIVVAVAAGVAAGAASYFGKDIYAEWIRPFQDWAREQTDFWDWAYGGIDRIMDAVGRIWGDAITPPRRDPLAIDLDGDGIETAAIPTDGSQPVLFDHNADGIRTGTGWVTGNDAWLVMDRDGNGSIDTGRELFGVDTEIIDPDTGRLRTAGTGFEALSAQDSNGDKVIDANDAAFNQLRLWRDLNQDGVSQADELLTFQQEGIESISLVSDGKTKDLGNGNTVTGSAKVTYNDGGETEVDGVALGGDAGNLNLSSNPFYREFTDTVPLTETARALPGMGGSGVLRDLQEAMSLGTPEGEALVAAVQAFGAATTREEQQALLDEVLLRWADSGQDLNAGLRDDTRHWVLLTHEASPTPDVGRENYEQLYGAALDASGADWRSLLALADFRADTFNDEAKSLLDLAQAQGLMSRYQFVPDANNDRNGTAYSETYVGEPLYSGIESMVGIHRTISILQQFNGSAFLRSEPRFVYLPDLHDSYLTTFSFVDVSDAQVALFEQAYDALRESVYSDLVVQTRLKPYLNSVVLLIDDTSVRYDTSATAAMLNAAWEASPDRALTDLVELNRYAFPTLNAVAFDGMGLLREWVDSLEADSPLHDTLNGLGVQGGAALAATDGSDIYLGDSDANSPSNAGDGDDMLDGGDGTDRLYGGDGNDSLLGRRGNDVLYGENDNDLLLGHEGNDSLYGGAGNDGFDGGTGNDYLSGGDGADVYDFSRGSGQDKIYNKDSDAFGTDADTLFINDVLPTDVNVWRSGTSLFIRLNDSTDQIELQGYFDGDGISTSSLEYIRFSDGTVWQTADVQALVQAGGAGNDAINGTAQADSLAGAQGSDQMHGAAGNDTLHGDAGTDTVYGDDGDDTTYGDAGNDVLWGGNGNDSLIGGDNADSLYGEAGNDTLDGGIGNDSLSGGAGADTYLFDKGAGRDRITNSDTDALGVNADTVQLGAGVEPTGVTLARSGNDLILSINGSTDQLTIGSYFSQDGASAYAVENIQFANGTVWDVATVKGKLLSSSAGADLLTGYASNDSISGGDGGDTLYGAAGDDTLRGGNSTDSLFGDDGADKLYGDAGKDTLSGGNGDDSLTGGSNDDTLYGNAGADSLDGGAGNDALWGGDGADTYTFGKGSGRDTVNNYDADALGVNADTVQLGTGVKTTGVTLARSGSDLILSINGTTDQLTVANYFSQDGASTYAVESIKFADGTVWDIATVKAKLLSSSTGADQLTGYASNDSISGGDGSDTLYGAAGDDTLRGGNSADSLYGEDGADALYGDVGKDTLTGGKGGDTLDGGAGDDALSGGDGADTYLFGKGSGRDSINNNDSDAIGANADTVQLGTGVKPAGVALSRSGNDLILSINGTTDRLTITSYFYQDGASSYAIENIKFADGTVWDIATVKAKLLTTSADADAVTGYASNESISGGDGADTLYGAAGDDTLRGGNSTDTLYGDDGADKIYGDAGKDTLTGGNGDDSLSGGTNDDALYGSAGADSLDGGAGNDALSGGDGADSYSFGKGSGRDTISNYDNDALGVNADAVQLGTGVKITGVTLTRSGNDLVLSINGTADQLTVTNYFYQDGTSKNLVENIKFASGDVWDYAYVSSHLYTPPAGSTFNGTSAADSITGGLGNDTLNGLAGDDTLDGGAGNDTLNGGSGNDRFAFGRGSGVDSITGADTAAGKLDVIALGSDVGTADVALSRESDDLVITINGTGDSLRIDDYFYKDATYGYQVEQVQFADGTVWDVTTVKAMVATASADNDSLTGYADADSLAGLAGEDRIYGRAGNDTLDGGAGNDYLAGEDGDDSLAGGLQNDTLYGGAGIDTLQGQDGSDALYGDAGDDVIDGGTGADTLTGGTGNDTFAFGKGSGADEITGADTTAGKLDAVQLGAGIAAGDVTLSREGDDLVMAINGTADILRVDNYFYKDAAYGYQVEQIKFADGTVWDVAAVKAKVAIGGADNDNLTGYAESDSLAGLAGEDRIYGRAGNDALDGGAGNDYLAGEDGDDSLLGGLQDDTLYGGAGIDTLQGQDGSDALYGDAGDDTIDGGAGADTLTGGTGNDTYAFGKGSGTDLITGADTTAGKLDAVQLGAGIAAGDVTLSREGDDLVMAINGTADSLRVDNYFYKDATYGYQVEQIKFADGTVWDVATVKAKVATGGADNDSLIGYAEADSLSGLAGDDRIYGRAGNDTLAGGAGNDYLAGEDGDDSLSGGLQDDTLYGGAGVDSLQGQDGSDEIYGDAGDDSLDGGAGADTLTGGTGNDTYAFGKGSGADEITGADTTAGKLDAVKLGAGIAADDVALAREGDDLVIAINGTADSLRIDNYFYKDATYGYQVDQIKFSDGTVWDVDTVKAKVATGSADNENLTGYAEADSLTGLAGEDLIYGRAGNDAIDGGAGADQLYGEDGDDSMRGGTQDDDLYGGNGSDSLQGQDGGDTLDGSAGNDTLDGGAGDDALTGGTGNDIFLFNRGTGWDTISGADTTASKLDVVKVGSDIAPGDLLARREGDDLVLTLRNSADGLRVDNYFYKDATYGYQVEQIQFADGTVWDVAAVKSMVLTASEADDTLTGYDSSDALAGLAGDDSLYGRAGNDVLDGGANNDRLEGQDGDDTLFGGTQNDALYGGNDADSLQGQDGNDSLYGDAGNDTLDGGSGNDTLTGSTGNDTYLFGQGSGADRLSDSDATVGNEDWVRFGTGVLKDSVTITRSGNNLQIAINGSSDSLTIESWYSSSRYQVEKFLWADGSISTAAEMEALAGGTGLMAEAAESGPRRRALPHWGKVQSVSPVTTEALAISLLTPAWVRWGEVEAAGRRWAATDRGTDLGGEQANAWAGADSFAALLSTSADDATRRHAQPAIGGDAERHRSARHLASIA